MTNNTAIKRSVILWGLAHLPLLALSDSNCSDGVVDNPQSRISRAELEQILQITPPAQPAAINSIIRNTAYCDVPSAQGVDRYAYPMAWDPDHWILLEYWNGMFIKVDFLLDRESN